MAEQYEIKIRGHLDPRWSTRFAGFKLAHLEGDGTLRSGLLPEPSALHRLLELVRDQNLTPISVSCGGPSTQQSDKEWSPDVGHAEGGIRCFRPQMHQTWPYHRVEDWLASGPFFHQPRWLSFDDTGEPTRVVIDT